MIPITAEAVRDAGEFGKMYFRVKENGTVTTILKVGYQLCFQLTEQDQLVKAIITKIIYDNEGLKIGIYTKIDNADILSYLSINQYFHVRTFTKDFNNACLHGVYYCKGARIYAVAAHRVKLLSLEESVGIITKIFRCEGFDQLLFKLYNSKGFRVINAAQMYGAIQLTPSEIPEQFMPVGIGARVRVLNLNKTGTVLGILFFRKSSSVPRAYILRSEDEILVVDFRDKVIADESPDQNIFESYHQREKSANEENTFLHATVALKTIEKTDEIHLVSIVREALHNFTGNNPVCGYFSFNESIAWSDYGFKCQPGENKRIVCSRTNMITLTDFE